MTAGSVMTATMRIGAAQRGHVRGSTSPHASRAEIAEIIETLSAGLNDISASPRPNHETL